MELLNISFESRRRNYSDSDSDSEERNSLNITGIRIDKNFLEQSIRDEYDDRLQEKEDELEDLREEVKFSRQRELDALKKYKNLEEDYDDYKFFANSRIKGLQNQIEQSKYDQRDYQNLLNENEDLLDENEDLNNKISRMREDANDNNIRFNQILNQKNAEQGFLINQLNAYQMANQINVGNVIKLNQQNNSLMREKQRSEEIINLQNSQIIQLKQELNKTKKELENSKILNQSVNIQYNQDNNYNYLSNNINNYDSNFNKPEEIVLKFISMNQSIKKAIKCYENELFSKVEEKLLKKCPELRGKRIIYLASGMALNRSKTVKENKLVNNIAIIMNIEDVQENNNINNININNNDNIFYDNPIDNIPLSTSYIPENDFSYSTETNNQINLNNNYTSISEPINNYIPSVNIDPFPQNNIGQEIETIPMNNANQINNDISQISVIPNQSQISVVPALSQISEVPNSSQISVVPNPSQISVVPNVSFYDPINEYNNNQISINSSQISVVPSIDMIKGTIENNNLNKANNNNISIVPNISYNFIPSNNMNQSNNMIILPTIIVNQNDENNNFEQF